MHPSACSPGSGRLSVGSDWLLYVDDGGHPATARLEQAAARQQPGRALAKALAAVDFEAPPFVFLRSTDRVHGMVFGELLVEVVDPDAAEAAATVVGTSAEPWASIDVPLSCWLTCGDVGLDELLWPNSGAVSAGGFRWSPLQPAPTEADGTGTFGGCAASTAAPTSQAAEDAETQAVQMSQGSSLRSHLDVEFDATTDAIRFAEMRRVAAQHGSSSGQSERRQQQSERSAMPRAGDPKEPKSASDAQASPRASEAPSSVEGDATIMLEPGRVLLDSLDSRRRVVEALVCLRCDSPNPPQAAHCRSCAEALSSVSTEMRRVAQPVLGVVRLSDGREELLDEDLLVGRKPSHRPLDPFQRAVVHGHGDRSVSRRHIELRLEQWVVMAINLQQAPGTHVTGRDGRRRELVAGEPQQFRAGDTIGFGGVWLRFEADK